MSATKSFVRLLTCTLALLLSLAMARSADLDPAIAVHAKKHREEIDKVLRKAEEAERLARDAYLVALDSVEKELIDKKDPAGAAVIDAERKNAPRLTSTSVDNASLPKKAQGSRKTFMKTLASIQESVVAGARRPNATYLAALNAIPGTAEKPELAKQVTAEKKRLLMGVGTVANLQTDLAGTLWRRVDDTKVIQAFTADHKWEGAGWVAEAPDRLKFDWGGKLYLAEGGNLLLGEDGKPNMTLERGHSSKVGK